MSKLSPSITLYTTATCHFCTNAKRLLQLKGLQQWDEIRVDLDPEQREIMVARTGRRTVPQIFIGNRHIGGFDDLSALDRSGGLDRLLSAAEEE